MTKTGRIYICSESRSMKSIGLRKSCRFIAQCVRRTWARDLSWNMTFVFDLHSDKLRLQIRVYDIIKIMLWRLNIINCERNVVMRFSDHKWGWNHLDVRVAVDVQMIVFFMKLSKKIVVTVEKLQCCLSQWNKTMIYLILLLKSGPWVEIFLINWAPMQEPFSESN